MPELWAHLAVVVALAVAAPAIGEAPELPAQAGSSGVTVLVGVQPAPSTELEAARVAIDDIRTRHRAPHAHGERIRARGVDGQPARAAIDGSAAGGCPARSVKPSPVPQARRLQRCLSHRRVTLAAGRVAGTT